MINHCNSPKNSIMRSYKHLDVMVSSTLAMDSTRVPSGHYPSCTGIPEFALMHMGLLPKILF